MRRDVGCDITLDVESACRAALLVAVARRPGLHVDDRLAVTLDGAALDVGDFDTRGGGRLHVVDCPAGRLQITYAAGVTGTGDGPEPADEQLLWELRRPSRYAPSDSMVGFAAREFGSMPHDASLLSAVASWVGVRLAYVPGSSGPTDGAVDTLLSGQGVCRDYAHLAVAILRALDVPARLVSVYAPGLSPMDFHAVVEAYLDGAWQVADPTTLAARSTLLRVATGRDAADTAFLTTAGGAVTLQSIQVFATSDPDPVPDDVRDVVQLA